MKITTSSGFKFDFDERLTDDWRVLKAISRADNRGNPEEVIAGCTDLVSIIFGKDEDRLIEHLKKQNDGFVPMEAIKNEIFSTFNQAKSLKNS
jgi:hypothetical protein